MSILYKWIRKNNAILWIQSSGNRLPAKKSLNTNLLFQRHTLWPLIILSTRIWSRLISKATAVEFVVNLEKDNLPGKIRLVTSGVKKDCRSKGNVHGGNTPMKSPNELPEWVTKKPVVSDTKDLATATMNRNNKKYKWCTSCNNGNGAWGFHWKDGN